jgi:hypothetical protein
MDTFICFAERANILLDVFHKVKNHPLLVVTGMEANRAGLAHLGQGFVQ